MKPLLSLFIFLSVSLVSNGQEIPDSALKPIYYFVYEKDSSNYVINKCNAFLQHKLTDKSRLTVLYYEGLAYGHLNLNDSALVFFKKALACDYTAYFNNYHNESCRAIADIFITAKQYDSTLHYLNICEKEYPYHSWGPMENYIYSTWDVSLSYARCYKGKGEYFKAISQLEPYIAEQSLFTSSSNYYMMDTLYSTYLKVYSKDSVKKKFNAAIKTIKVHIKKQKNDSIPYVYATVKISGRIQIFSQSLDFPYILNKRPDTISNTYLKKEAIESFQKLRIYKLATQTLDEKKED